MKLKSGKYLIETEVFESGDSIHLKFPYSVALKDEIKQMKGARWDPDTKTWKVSNCQRNKFQLGYLACEDVYARYDAPLLQVDFKPRYNKIKKQTFTPMLQQQLMVRHGLTRRCCIIAGEMGTGKSLAAIEIMERSERPYWWWISSKTALESVKLECYAWDSAILPTFMTYDQLRITMERWQPGKPAPQGVVFDEAARLKTPNAKRSLAGMQLADAIRAENNGYVILMSGSPAPKSPLDWYNQTEIACPGFLKEGTIEKLKQTLAIVEMRDSIAGGQFPYLIAWRDDERRCKTCGNYADAKVHYDVLEPGVHAFSPSVNEVARLYKRMAGLVQVCFKRDCMDLPDKYYETITIEPSADTLRALELIKETAPTAIMALTLARELSDGFLYEKVKTGEEVCPHCQGSRTMTLPEIGEMACDFCNGSGIQETFETVAKEVSCAKDDAMVEVMESVEDTGRLVVYAGFTASIDRCCNVATRNKWEYIRVDGRGWTSSLGIKDKQELLKLFLTKDDRKIVFIGHPDSAGEGLTLTSSNTILYYSNSFSGSARTQSEDRIHRPGMDMNKGARIIDLIHLPTDKLVLDNLKKKRDLEKMTLGEMKLQIGDNSVLR